MEIIPILFSLAAAAAYLAQLSHAVPRQHRGKWVAAAGGLHAVALAGHFFATSLHLGTFISLFVLSTLAVCWRLLHALLLRRVLLSLAAAAALAPMLPHKAVAVLSVHSALALAVYALAAAALLLCLDVRLVEQQLRRQPPQGGDAPPLLQRERQVFVYVLLSFVLLSGTLVSGILSALAVQAPPFAFTHKQLFAYLTWLVFAVLLAGRHFLGWRGRVAQRWFFAGYALLLLSYLGSTVVAQFVLGRGGG